MNRINEPGSEPANGGKLELLESSALKEISVPATEFISFVTSPLKLAKEKPLVALLSIGLALGLKAIPELIPLEIVPQPWREKKMKTEAIRMEMATAAERLKHSLVFFDEACNGRMSVNDMKTRVECVLESLVMYLYAAHTKQRNSDLYLSAVMKFKVCAEVTELACLLENFEGVPMLSIREQESIGSMWAVEKKDPGASPHLELKDILPKGSVVEPIDTKDVLDRVHKELQRAWLTKETQKMLLMVEHLSVLLRELNAPIATYESSDLIPDKVSGRFPQMRKSALCKLWQWPIFKRPIKCQAQSSAPRLLPGPGITAANHSNMFV